MTPDERKIAMKVMQDFKKGIRGAYATKLKPTKIEIGIGAPGAMEEEPEPMDPNESQESEPGEGDMGAMPPEEGQMPDDGTNEGEGDGEDVPDEETMRKLMELYDSEKE